MTNWNPKNGDYVKENAMEDSHRRKKAEKKRKITIYGITMLIIVIVLVLIVYVI